MAQAYTLPYGNGQITLAKSASLFALRPRSGMAEALRYRLEQEPAVIARPQRLGGFQLAAVPSGDDVESPLDALRGDPTVAAGSHIFHTSGDGVPFVPTGRIAIRFKRRARKADREKLLRAAELVINGVSGGGWLNASITRRAPNPVKTAHWLLQSGLVAAAEPELASPIKSKGFAVPMDALLGSQWHLRNNGNATGLTAKADARVVDAWTAGQTLGSPQVVVAIIDDGFDLRHPDLGPAERIVDPWDFVRNNANPSIDPLLETWHGTACAGVAIGRAGGGTILGAAPGASFMPIRHGLDTADSSIAAWIDHATKKAWVVNLSFGSDAAYFPLGQDSRRALTDCATKGRGGRGCVIVVAAGNDGVDINNPAGGTLDGFAIHPHVIAVAASNSMDNYLPESNFGREIAVTAPAGGSGGLAIVTADAIGSGIGRDGIDIHFGYNETDYTMTTGGFGQTSSACALVAGIAALMLSVNPALTAAQVKAILAATARKIGDPPPGREGLYGAGCVDAAAAVREAIRLK